MQSKLKRRKIETRLQRVSHAPKTNVKASIQRYVVSLFENICLHSPIDSNWSMNFHWNPMHFVALCTFIVCINVCVTFPNTFHMSIINFNVLTMLRLVTTWQSFTAIGLTISQLSNWWCVVRCTFTTQSKLRKTSIRITQGTFYVRCVLPHTANNEWQKCMVMQLCKRRRWKKVLLIRFTCT